MQEILLLLRKLGHDRFYGSVTLKFEAGQVVFLKKEETIKPADLSGQPRSQDAGQEEQ
jgi:hypothetical protein